MCMKHIELLESPPRYVYKVFTKKGKYLYSPFYYQNRHFPYTTPIRLREYSSYRRHGQIFSYMHNENIKEGGYHCVATVSDALDFIHHELLLLRSSTDSCVIYKFNIPSDAKCYKGIIYFEPLGCSAINLSIPCYMVSRLINPIKIRSVSVEVK